MSQSTLLQTLFDQSNAFTAFTMDQLAPIVIIFFFAGMVIYHQKKFGSKNSQRFIGAGLATITTIAVLSRMLFTSMDGSFTIEAELPIHLCRLMAFILPFAMFTKNRYWLGLSYFIIIAGTLQALITPDLPLSSPHYSYYIYWILHGFLFVLPFYIIIVYGLIPTKKDLWNAFIILNIYAAFTILINCILNSNYFYTWHKPEAASLLDYLGPWPIYIVAVELIGLLFFYIAYLPIMYLNKVKRDI